MTIDEALKYIKTAGHCTVMHGDSDITAVPKEALVLVADVFARAGEIHRDCHDLVCSGDRHYPRGEKGHTCSCAGRDTAYAELIDLKARTCETCRHQYMWSFVAYCRNTGDGERDDQFQRCERLGGFCGAWEQR